MQMLGERGLEVLLAESDSVKQQPPTQMNAVARLALPLLVALGAVPAADKAH